MRAEREKHEAVEVCGKLEVDQFKGGFGFGSFRSFLPSFVV